MYETLLPCPVPSCRGRHGVRAVRSSKRGPAGPFTGPFVSPLRPETPRTGVDVLAVGSPPSRDPASTPVQAASSLASRASGERG